MNSTCVIGITGKRDLYPQKISKLKKTIKDTINSIAITEKEKGVSAITGISPLALGADTLFAEIMIESGYPIRSFLPFEKAEYIKDFTTTESKQKFETLYDAIPPENKAEINTLAGNDRNALYMDAGKKVVDNCDYIIAIWEEIPGKPGGTGDVVKYLLDYNEEELWKTQGKKNKLKKIISICITPEQPVVTTFFPGIIKGNLVNISPSLFTQNQTPDKSLPIFLSSEKAEHDLMSTRLKNQHKSIWLTCSWVGLIAVICFALSHIAADKKYECMSTWCTALEFICIVAIPLLLFVKKPEKKHSKFLLNRFITEQFRILKTYFWAGIPLPGDLENPMFDQISKHHNWNSSNLQDLNNLVKARSLFINQHKAFPAADYRKEPITSLIEEQLNYHNNRRRKTEGDLSIHKWSVMCLFGLFCVVVLLHLLSQFLSLPHKECAEPVLFFLSLVVPAIIAQQEAKKVFQEWEKLSLQSNAMINFFEFQKKRLLEAGNKQLQDILNDINQQMFYENLDWQLSMLEKEPPLPA